MRQEVWEEYVNEHQAARALQPRWYVGGAILALGVALVCFSMGWWSALPIALLAWQLCVIMAGILLTTPGRTQSEGYADPPAAPTVDSVPVQKPAEERDQ